MENNENVTSFFFDDDKNLNNERSYLKENDNIRELKNNAGTDSQTEIIIEPQQTFYYFAPDTPSQRALMDVDLPSRPKPIMCLIMTFIPCFVGNPCSSEKKEEYKQATKTLCLFISIVQVIMWIAAMSIGSVINPSENWLLGPGNETWIALGGKYPYAMKEQWQIWRFITPVFLHSGILHIVINMFIQLRVGLLLERKWGWYKYISIFFIGGLGGILLSCLLQPDTLATGASIPVISMLGAYFTQLCLTWHKSETWQRTINMIQCLLFMFIEFGISFGPDFIDISAQCGGLIIGLILAFSVFGKEYARTDNILATKIIPAIALTIIFLYFIIGYILFYTVVPTKKYDS